MRRPPISALFPYTTLFRSVNTALDWLLSRPSRENGHLTTINVENGLIVPPALRSLASFQIPDGASFLQRRDERPGFHWAHASSLRILADSRGICAIV